MHKKSYNAIITETFLNVSKNKNKANNIQAISINMIAKYHIFSFYNLAF